MGRLSLEQMYDPQASLAHDLAYVRYEVKPRSALRARKRIKTLPTHIFIPDTQVKPGVDTRQLDWIGSYIADSFGDREQVKIIVGGDWWDMPSLSSYDKGKKRMENQRVVGDLAAGNEAFARFCSYLPRKKSWEYHFLFGNHEDRITRAIEDNAQLDGLLSLDLCDTQWFQRHEFEVPVNIDGIRYCHYFKPTNSPRPYSGQAEGRLKNVGTSFTQGHEPTLLSAVRYVDGHAMRAMIAGACYLQNEHFKGWQGNHHFRGIIVKNEVEAPWGSYSLLEVTLDFLCRRYEGIRLSEYLEKTAA